MKYKILLFDLDNTLLDFSKAEEDGLSMVFRNFGYNKDEFLDTYLAVNSSLWHQYEEGLIPLNQVLNTRFSLTMLEHGIAVDGAEWEALYRSYLRDSCHPMPGALEALAALSRLCRLFIITNGVSETQANRLEKSGLRKYFEAVFASQDIGHQKPSSEFFDYVKNHIAGFDPEAALVIGDSVSTDILGGIQAGIDTCLLGKTHADCEISEKSTYVIPNLNKLCEILGIA